MNPLHHHHHPAPWLAARLRSACAPAGGATGPAILGTGQALGLQAGPLPLAVASPSSPGRQGRALGMPSSGTGAWYSGAPGQGRAHGVRARLATDGRMVFGRAWPRTGAGYSAASAQGQAQDTPGSGTGLPLVRHTRIPSAFSHTGKRCQNLPRPTRSAIAADRKKPERGETHKPKPSKRPALPQHRRPSNATQLICTEERNA